MGSRTVVVIGGGHAGAEAALAAGRVGARVVLVTAEPRAVSIMPCNPAIGGVAKGTLVREIDALGGAMGLSADGSALQFRMLNMKKGPAVWGPRIQADSRVYPELVRRMLDQAGIRVRPGMAVSLQGGPERYTGVVLSDGSTVRGHAFVLATGTCLGGVLFRGREKWPGGRSGGLSSVGLDRFLRERFHVERFKTGTSPRVVTSTVRIEALETQQAHDSRYRFSVEETDNRLPRMNCHLARTNRRTGEVVKSSMEESPLYSGNISGKGPRYCPSFEDKVVRFPDRTSHPLHLEPVSATSRLSYLNGLSTSMPQDVQYRMLRTIEGFRKAEIAEFGYAVEYTVLAWGEYDSTLKLRGTGNLFAAGQILGTSGYEEAAALGLLAGANAAREAEGLAPLTPDRRTGYLGVMVDDLVRRGTDEPYRLFSSRAENRLHLRQDNAHLRMRTLGVELGVLSGRRLERVAQLEEEYAGAMADLSKPSLQMLCKRPETTIPIIIDNCPGLQKRDGGAVQAAVFGIRYSGYISRQERRERAIRINYGMPVPRDFEGSGISTEAIQALRRHRPETLEDASKLSGVRASDLEILALLSLKTGRST